MGSLFVKINYALPLILFSIAALAMMNLSNIDFIFAQSGNSLSQEGDGNEASQSDEYSQNSNQNSMCVSGESTSSSCNNLSSESTGAHGQDEQGPAGPRGEKGDKGPEGPAGVQSINGKAYKITGKAAGDGETSTAKCKEGDTVISGGFKLFKDSSTYEFRLNSVPTDDLDGWEVSASGGRADVTPVAICFDNP
jgi:hypothetical protein